MPFSEVAQRIEVPACLDVDLPYDDGELLESYWHHQQIYLLGDMLNEHWPERTDVFAGGNMFLYYSLQQVRNRDYKGPDFFVVTGVDGARMRHSWITWEENGRYPDVIIELLSPTTRDQDLGPKKDLYEQVFQTTEYFCVDPDDWSLLGWRLNRGHYDRLLPNAQGWLWSDTLGVWLGFQEGRFQRKNAIWLRFFTSSGVLVPTAEENAAAARAHAEAEHAHAEAEHAHAEAERAHAEAEHAHAEAERAHAEAEHEHTEAERVRAETAEAENARLRAELEQLRRTMS